MKEGGAPGSGGHVPERTCIGCRTRFPKRELVRVASRDGLAVLDSQQAIDGRGAYVCPRRKCLRAAVGKHAFKRALPALAGEPDLEHLWEQLPPSARRA